MMSLSITHLAICRSTGVIIITAQKAILSLQKSQTTGCKQFCENNMGRWVITSWAYWASLKLDRVCVLLDRQKWDATEITRGQEPDDVLLSKFP